MTELFKLDELVRAVVLHRPSKVSKTPYVADIHLVDENGNCQKNEDGENIIYQAHCPSLGCCGLCEVGSVVFVGRVEEKKGKNGKPLKNKRVCQFIVYLSLLEEKEKHHKEIIGIHPKLAERIVECCLQKDVLTNFSAIQYKREVTLENSNSRFDFAGTTCNRNPFVLEVKNVPLADYADCSAKERKKMDFSYRVCHEKISYFPDGYRKKKNAVVSPRALKHIQELKKIGNTTFNEPYMCYVIQRTDSNCFQTSVMDPIYKEAVRDAVENGEVEIIVVGVKWTEDGRCLFHRDDYVVNL